VRLACELESFPWPISTPTTRIRSAGCADSADGHAANELNRFDEIAPSHGLASEAFR
jgi:hypothetical protein